MRVFQLRHSTNCAVVACLECLFRRSSEEQAQKISDVAETSAPSWPRLAVRRNGFAMHQVKIAWHRPPPRRCPLLLQFLRTLQSTRWLLALSMMEGSGGGEIRLSHAPIQILTMGEFDSFASILYIDGAVRRRDCHDGAARSRGGQHREVLAVFRRQDYTLEPTSTWDTLGMRGTCSVGYLMRAQGEASQVLPELFERIHTPDSGPYAHLLWSSTWQGVASGAVRRARSFARQASRASGGKMPPGAPHQPRPASPWRRCAPRFSPRWPTTKAASLNTMRLMR